MRILQILGLIFCLLSCNSKQQLPKTISLDHKNQSNQYITVLGIAQDAGFPQINCDKMCCSSYYKGYETKKLVSCLGLVDLEAKKKYIFDATPDFTEQIQGLKVIHLDNGNVIDGVFLTHAHIGHYTGLMYLGFEALGGDNIPVYAMPRMKDYLETNGPWSQLVSFKNIDLKPLKNDSTIRLCSNLKVTPILVPHRDEFSETVGYKIEGPNKKALFIPDIDKWQKWDKNIIEEVKKVDYAFLDASFFRDGELERDMSKIPHPFTTETTSLFENESIETKSKIHFIHFNHTNPAIRDSHVLKDSIQALGFRFAKEGDNFKL
ncbi:MBL fold metallo-hydrolase [Ichthyenterobacterium sp. W332]|uniref:MBL fold metallo-hydrolase n=1 Tax=Microcosmobacter mediterraneus TaxID=3075607 RepID=A0ABU2YMZ1_9FLAO|nr:MBL fold metallo-hydrolase [Ichthyenterobacterium sp. W332]MDT0559256.1 MBL fold metallo-hydrolase [Ichthyenterobacterium sp. W332]